MPRDASTGNSKGRPQPAPDPNKLKRVEAGRYRSADGRFEARQSGVGWLLVDTASTDELGQPVIHGPYVSLDALAGALPAARRAAFRQAE